MKHHSKHIDAQKLEKALYRLAHSTVPSDEFISKTRTRLFQKIEKSSRRPLLNIFSPIYRFSFGAFTALVVLTLFGTVFSLNTLETYAKEIGEVNVTEGEVTIQRNNETLVVHGKSDIRIGDVIHVSEDSKAKVSFYKQADTLLSAKTTVAITDVKETTVNGKQEKEIHLNLAEGKIETTPELTQLDTTLHIETEKGIVKAGTDAQVTVSSTDQNVLVSVGKDSAEIISPTAQNSMVTTLDAGHELALGTPTTVENVPVIATTATLPIIPEIKQIFVASGTTLQEVLPVESPEKQQYLTEMNGMLEIAEIKLRSSLKFFERGDEIGAYNAALGYTQTVDRLLTHLGVTHESLVKNKKDDVVAIRSLSRNYLDQSITALSSKDLDQKEAFTIKARIENLYDVESSVIVFMTTEKTNLHESGIANNTNIETTVAKVVNTRIDTILAISNPDEKAKEFTSYLKSIPNDDHAKKTLLGILNRVPQELKGYVHMKLHDIEASN